MESRNYKWEYIVEMKSGKVLGLLRDAKAYVWWWKDLVENREWKGRR